MSKPFGLESREMEEAELRAAVERLQSQLSRGEPILFLGAGFSLSAQDREKRPMPGSAQLTEELWKLAFPGDPFESSTNLGDAYYAASSRDPKAVSEMLNSRLRVDAESLPDQYASWFAMPWSRCYSLNIDDLEQAVARRFALARGIRSVSATGEAVVGDLSPGALEVVHLNGFIGDELDHLTFSERDYGSRLSTPDAWYVKCSTELLARPVVFVGTELHESTLWQYLEFERHEVGVAFGNSDLVRTS